MRALLGKMKMRFCRHDFTDGPTSYSGHGHDYAGIPVRRYRTRSQCMRCGKVVVSTQEQRYLEGR